MRRRIIAFVLLAAGLLAAAAAVSISTRRPRRLWRTEAETAAVRAALTLQWAAGRFATRNGGFFPTPECLVAPAGCLPGYDGPPFLDVTFDAAAREAGYRFIFHRGRPATEWAGGTAPVYPDSVQTFVVVAIPSRNTWWGPRSVCADSTMRICLSTASSFDTSDGLCPAVCTRGDSGR